MVFQVSHRNMLTSVAANNLGDMVSSYHTPLPMLILLLSLCRWTVIELLGVDVFQEFDVQIFCLLFLKRHQYCFSLHQVEGLLVVDKHDTEWDIMFSALLLQLVYDVDMVCC